MIENQREASAHPCHPIMVAITRNDRSRTHQALLRESKGNISNLLPRWDVSMEVDGVSVSPGPDPGGSKRAGEVILSVPSFVAAVWNFEAAKGVVAAVGVQLSVGDVVVLGAQQEGVLAHRLANCVEPDIDLDVS